MVLDSDASTSSVAQPCIQGLSEWVVFGSTAGAWFEQIPHEKHTAAAAVEKLDQAKCQIGSTNQAGDPAFWYITT